MLDETVDHDPLRLKGQGGQALYDTAMYQLQLIAQKQREREAMVRKSSQIPFVADLLQIISEFLGAPYSLSSPAYRPYHSKDEPSFRHDALSRSSSVDAKLQLAVTLLEESASVHNHDDALFTLADMNFVSLCLHFCFFGKFVNFHLLSWPNSTTSFPI